MGFYIYRSTGSDDQKLTHMHVANLDIYTQMLIKESKQTKKTKKQNNGERKSERRL